MSFTTPCFIRNNTPELRKRLIELGYTVFPNMLQFPCLSTGSGIGLPCDNYNRDGGYDCGTNEELFLAIAALRDDSDYMQYFTDGKHWYIHVSEDSKDQFDQGSMFLVRMKLNGFHKATIQELIEHFKTEE